MARDLAEEHRVASDDLEGPDLRARELQRDLDLRHEMLRGKRDEKGFAHDDIPMSERFSR